MKVVKEKKVEDCLESTSVKDFLFDETIDKSFVDYLAQLGKLIFVDEIEKPFFKVIVKGKFTIKGSVGNKSIRLILPDLSEETNKNLEELKQLIEKFNENRV